MCAALLGAASGPAVAQPIAQPATQPSVFTVPEPVATPAKIAADTAASVALDAAAQLHLEVFVNGVSSRLIVPVRQAADGRLWMQAEELRGLHVAPPLQDNAAAPEAHDGDWIAGWIDLAALPGLQTRYDEATQTLHLHAQDAAMVVREFDVAATQRAGAESAAQTPTHFGAFVNHTLYANSGGNAWAGVTRTQTVSGLLEANVYGRLGVLTSTQLLTLNRHAQNTSRIDKRLRTVRLDTTWSWYDEDRLMTVAAGDLVGSGLAWSRAVRLGGVQVRRNFSIRPDLVTMPMLDGLTGSAAVPSTVELYVNNARRFAQEVAPGPFAITNLPLITGAGTARLVVRDALGRETVSETPFYASSSLLAQGLADFALEAGVARRNTGVRSNDYDKRLLANATLRYGLTNAATVEATVQGADKGADGGRLALAGAGGVWRLGTFGVASLAGAASRYQPGNQLGNSAERGAQFTLDFETEWRGITLNTRHQRTAGRFNDLVSATLELPATIPPAQAALARLSARPPRRMSQFSLGLPSYTGAAWSIPSLSLSYTPVTQADGSRTRLVGLSMGQRLPAMLGDGWLSVSAFRDLAQHRSGSIFAMLSWFLGNRMSTSASVSKSRGNLAQTTLEVSQSERDAYGSLGWRLRSNQGLNQRIDNKTQSAIASYRHRYGRVEVGVEHANQNGQGGGQVSGRLQLDGAVVLAGGGVFLANRIYDAFGVVNVGAPDVRVLFENNAIGQTDAGGRVLLTGLRAYGRNQIAIDPMTLPVDAHIPVLKQVVRPRFRSGVVVDFDVAVQTRTALVTLLDASGAHLPVGTTVRLNDGEETVVGYDGQVWLDTVGEHNRLAAVLADGGTCAATFTAPPTMTERLVLPEAVCRRE